MLILAGVSINAIVGDNGVLTKAQAASIASRKASILEELNLELASYNIDSILNNPKQTTTMLGNLITKGLIDTILSSSNEYVADASSPIGIPQFDDDNNYTGYIDYVVKKDNYSIIISVDDSGIYKAEYGGVDISSGGSVASGTTIVTEKAFTNNEGASAEEQGKFVIDNDASVMFVDEISGELSIQVKSGIHAKVYAFKDMTLTNEGIKRSAIDIEPGGVLDLYVAEDATLNVHSGFAEEGEKATGWNAKGGAGGYAGIHVPSNENGIATLNLSGNGTIISRGGDASDGNGTYGTGDSNTGGGGGGGAGAGIGGNGGKGGNANKEISNRIEGSGYDGESGENCGIINIYNAITVYAYGGSGGAAIPGTNAYAGTGGGGYPAAGIGGGGAGGGGGDHAMGGGGYCGGCSQDQLARADNGKSAIATYGLMGSGGGYLEAGHLINLSDQRLIPISTYGNIGGQGALRGGENTQGGDGGIAGKGGTVNTSNSAKIYAYNGNKYTDDEESHQYDNGLNQLEIYCQNGVLRDVYKYSIFFNNKEYRYISFFKSLLGEKVSQNIDSYVEHNENPWKNYLIRPASTTNLTGYINSKNGTVYGIGSGAGYIELSNGTFAVDPSMN